MQQINLLTYVELGAALREDTAMVYLIPGAAPPAQQENKPTE